MKKYVAILTKFFDHPRILYGLMILVLVIGGFVFGVMMAKGQYLPLMLLIAVLAIIFFVFIIKPSGFFMFIFSIGVPFSYSYSVFTRDDPGSGLIWPRIIRDAIILLFVIHLVLRAIHWKNSELWNQRKALPLVLFLVYIAVLGFFSLDLPLTTMWVGLKYYLVLPLMGLLIPVAIKNRDTLRSALGLFFSVAIIIAFIGILEALADNPFVTRYKSGSLFGLKISRASSVWGNPLTLAGYLGLVLAFWHPLQRDMPEGFQGWTGRLITVIFWFCLLLTLSRSSLLALVASFGLSIMLLSQKRSRLIWGFILLVALVPLLNLITWFRTPPDVGGGILGILPNNLRFEVWSRIFFSQYIHIPLHQNLFGRGLGANSGVIHLNNLQAPGAELIKTNSMPTDNYYLTALFEMGFVGLVFFGFLYLAYLRVCIELYREAKDKFSKRVYASVLMGMLFFLIRNLFLQGMRTFLAGFYFWVLIGIMVAVNNIDRLTDSGSAQAG
jgi:O-antigen ligase